MLDASSPCPYCGKLMRLDETHVRVPQFGRRFWQRNERSEYRCKACGEYGVMRVGRLGLVLYATLVPALVVAWTHGIKHAVVVSAGLVTAAVIYRGASRLTPARTTG